MIMFLFLFLFSMKHSHLLTAKITQDIIFTDFTWYERATVSNSLHVRSNFRCLIMASTKLMQYMSRHYFLQKVDIIILIFCLNSLTECPYLAFIYYQVSVSLLLTGLEIWG